MKKIRLNTEWNRLPVLQRYEVDQASGCWNWKGFRLASGYGHVQVNKRRLGAHRYFYEQHKGSIPDGMFICHSCDNRSCVNPEHLWIGSAQDNVDDMIAKKREVRKPKLTEQQAAAIRQDTRTTAVIAADHGISPSNVSFIQTGQTWKHLQAKPRAARVTGPRTSLTEVDVRAIRADVRLHREIAAEYGVTASCISFIKLRKSWAHVD